MIAADPGHLDNVEPVLQVTDSLDVGLLVASAGFGAAGNFVTTSAQDEINMLDVNCRAVRTMIVSGIMVGRTKHHDGNKAQTAPNQPA